MVSACKPVIPYSDMSDDELHTRATARSLPDRYALYVDVLRSELPPRLILASDVASMGEPAWTYTMARATGGSVQDLSDAMPVLWAFDRRCTPLELDRLRRHIKTIGFEAAADRINTLCGSGLPAGD